MRRTVWLRRSTLGGGLAGTMAAALVSLTACNALLDDFVYVDAGGAEGVEASVVGDASLDATSSPDATLDATTDAASDDGPALDASADDAAGDAADAGPLTYRAAVLAANPIAYWRLGEIGNNDAYSETGDGAYTATYKYNVTLGTPGAIDTDQNTAIYLDGGKAVVEFLGGFSAIDQRSFAIEMWFRPAHPASNPFYHYLVKSVDPTTSVSLFYQEAGDASLHGKAAATNVQSPVDPTVGAWNYVVLQANNVQLILCLNVVNCLNMALSLDAGVADAAADASTFDIGGDPSAFETFDGDLDEVAVYPMPLDTATMALHYSLAGPHDAGP